MLATISTALTLLVSGSRRFARPEYGVAFARGLGRDARRIVDALVPLARAGELDAAVVRVLRYRRAAAAPSR